MDKIIIRTNKAPVTQPAGSARPIYSQAVKAGGVIYVAGFVAFDSNGKLVPGEIKEQTTQVLENIKAVLEAGGSSMADVVKTTVYLKDVKDFAGMNEVFKTYFLDDPPCRVTVGITLPLPELLIEIDAIAVPSS